MNRPSNALAELLAGKTPEAMYDALYAGRYLSEEGKDAPAKVLDLIKTFLRSTRQRSPLTSRLMERIAAALVQSGFLNEAGEQLGLRKVTDG